MITTKIRARKTSHRFCHAWFPKTVEAKLESRTIGDTVPFHKKKTPFFQDKSCCRLLWHCFEVLARVERL